MHEWVAYDCFSLINETNNDNNIFVMDNKMPIELSLKYKKCENWAFLSLTETF